MIKLTTKGNFNHTERFLKKMSKAEFYKVLDKYGQKGVQALSTATPVDTGKTAESWNYYIKKTKTSAYIYWTNSNVNNGVNIAIILQYGHGTRNGGYVQGRDYINPAMRLIFDEMANAVWEEVTSA